MSLEKDIRENEKQYLEEMADRDRKIEELVRMGLMPIQQLPLLKKAFELMDKDMYLPYQYRSIFYDFIRELLNMSLADPTITRLIKNKTSLKKYEEVEMSTENTETVNEASVGISLKGAPEGTLMSYASIVRRKIRAGAKPSDADRKLAAKAKAEMRRRRNVQAKRMSESFDLTEGYAEKFKLAMEHFGISSVQELTDENKKAFFNYIDNN